MALTNAYLQTTKNLQSIINSVRTLLTECVSYSKQV